MVVAAVIGAILEEMGFDVRSANGGAEALIALAASPPDLLVSDVMLDEGMNGGALARAAQLLRPELKVLLTSGYSAASLPPECAGYPFVAKPYTFERLEAAVERAMGAAGAVPAE